MRRVTIKRQVALAGAFQEVTVYAENADRGTEEIGGVICKKACTLKNGQNRCFDIGNDAVRVFAITTTSSNEKIITEYTVDPGSSPLLIQGKCKLNDAESAEFSFSSCSVPSSISSGGSRGSKGLMILVAILISCVLLPLPYLYRLLSYSISMSNPLDFKAGEMTITLTEGFSENYQPVLYKEFHANDCWLGVERQGYDVFPELRDISANEYCAMIKENSGKTASTVLTKDGLTYFVFDYYSPEADETFVYYLFAYKSSSAAWFIQFSASEDDVNKLEDDFFEWAGSVRFDY